jgi:hypothetical protein
VAEQGRAGQGRAGPGRSRTEPGVRRRHRRLVRQSRHASPSNHQPMHAAKVPPPAHLCHDIIGCLLLRGGAQHGAAEAGSLERRPAAAQGARQRAGRSRGDPKGPHLQARRAKEGVILEVHSVLQLLVGRAGGQGWWAEGGCPAAAVAPVASVVRRQPVSAPRRLCRHQNNCRRARWKLLTG